MVTLLNDPQIVPQPDSSGSLEQLLTLKEAMGYLRVSRSTLYRLMWSGQLTGHKVGSQWRFLISDMKNCVRPEQQEGGEA
jgi:excisionase family DNA binding protein